MKNTHCPTCTRPMVAEQEKASIADVGFCSVQCRITWWQRHDRRVTSVKVTFDRRKKP